MLKTKTTAQGRLPGCYQQREGMDDVSFSVWLYSQEQNALKSLADSDALCNHICADDESIQLGKHILCKA